MAPITGTSSGNTIKVISIQSRKKPSRNTQTITKRIMPLSLKGNDVRASSMISSPPKARTTKAKTVAPIIMQKI